MTKKRRYLIAFGTILGLYVAYEIMRPRYVFRPGKMSFATAQEQSFHRDKQYIYADWMDKAKRAQMPDGSPLVDLNKVPLRFMPLGDKYLLTSAGEDKEFNTKDDVETTIVFQ